MIEWKEFSEPCIEIFKSKGIANEEEYNKKKTLLCCFCDKFNHLLGQCPSSWSGTNLGRLRYGAIEAAARLERCKIEKAIAAILLVGEGPGTSAQPPVETIKWSDPYTVQLITGYLANSRCPPCEMDPIAWIEEAAGGVDPSDTLEDVYRRVAGFEDQAQIFFSMEMGNPGKF